MPEFPGVLARRTLLRAAAGGAFAASAYPLLAGCDNGSGAAAAADYFGEPAARPLDVVIFNGGFGEDYAKAHEAMFVERHPGAKVKHTATKTIRDDLDPRFLHGTPPDVMNNDGANAFVLGTLVNEGVLCDLTELLEAPSLDDPAAKVGDALLPGTVTAGTFNGRLYSLNYALTVFGLFRDAALWDRQGWQPPKTWDEFLALAPKMKAAGVAPWAHAGQYPYYMGWPIADWIQKIGGREAALRIDNLEPGAWRQDAVRTAISMVIEMVRKGYVLPGSDKLSHTESQQALIDGKAAILPCGTWLENEMKETLPAEVKLTIAPVWSASAGDKMPYETVRASAAGAFVVPTKAANKAGGLEYLRIMLSRPAARKFSELTRSLSCVAGAADAVTGSAGLSSAAAVMKQAGPNTISWRFNDWYGDLDKAWQAAIAEVMSGAITKPEDFSARLQRAADDVAKDSSITKYTRDE
ncbi:N-acetylglucosamine/diacetylchitobiose ABC transporter substrate-binding protein [Actinoplanes sp. NPDC049548]|uniref:N-acetylglucosamine/diacetylchitobiose ABC transporter substrate-binding protein n=1 Tax=Actinoplanes sp. NPDC049548 TaxID=3155152 RepID=UPI0034122F48